MKDKEFKDLKLKNEKKETNNDIDDEDEVNNIIANENSNESYMDRLLKAIRLELLLK